MWVNLEDGMTWEQVSERIWSHLSPDLREMVTEHCAATGESRDDYFRDLNTQFEAKMHDPEYRARFLQWLDRERFPCGRDPLRKG